VNNEERTENEEISREKAQKAQKTFDRVGRV
jgi:hypothetical protein